MIKILYKCEGNMIEIQTHFLVAQEKLVTAPFVAETTCRDPAAPQSRVELQKKMYLKKKRLTFYICQNCKLCISKY